MKVLLANPRGFCAGVDRAILIVETVLKRYGAPIYVRHEVVHNTYVVDRLKNQGVIFVETLNDVPDAAIVIFSAHGTPKSVADEAIKRGLRVFDATCPLVTKVHGEVLRLSQTGHEIVMIGHAGHPEVEGTMGQCEGIIHLVENVKDVQTLAIKNPDKLGVVTQTTLSQDDAKDIIAALRARFPQILLPRREDICYATQNRQNAARRLAQKVDVMIVVGSPNSSNSNRLREVAARLGKVAYRIDRAEELQRSWFAGADLIGVTAGASAPEVLAQDVVSQLKTWGAEDALEDEGVKENVVFSLPRALSEPLAEDH